MAANLHKNIEDAFALFACADGSGIEACDMGAVVRSAGLNPTEAGVAELRGAAAGQGGRVTLPVLQAAVEARQDSLVVAPGELEEALQALDKAGSASLEVQDLVHALTSLGEKLSGDTLDEFIRDVDQNGEGHVHIADVMAVLAGAR